MTTFGIAGLQLEGQRGNNVDSMIDEIDLVKARFPWVSMVVLAELNAFGPRRTDATALPSATEAPFRRSGSLQRDMADTGHDVRTGGR